MDWSPIYAAVGNRRHGGRESKRGTLTSVDSLQIKLMAGECQPLSRRHQRRIRVAWWNEREGNVIHIIVPLRHWSYPGVGRVLPATSRKGRRRRYWEVYIGKGR